MRTISIKHEAREAADLAVAAAEPSEMPVDVTKLHAKKRHITADESEKTSAKKPKTKIQKQIVTAPSSTYRPTGSAKGKKAMAIRACIREVSRLQKDLLPELAKALSSHPGELSKILQKIRDFIHEIEYSRHLYQEGIKASGILGQQGLPMIADNQMDGFKFPTDIMLDASALYRRWAAGDIEADVYRGMILSKVKRSYVKEPDYQFSVKCDYRGAGNLIIGQWFATHLSAKILGAHGNPDGGIYGSRITGAFSIMLSSGYSNEDDGDHIEYCGTRSKPNAGLTPSTAAMLKSFQERYPIRVVRSSSSVVSGRYRPECGLRYDGLYTITICTLVDREHSDYRFFLERELGQPPIRYEGPEARPSNVEVRKLAAAQAPGG